MNGNEGFSGRLSIAYVEIVKYFSLALSTVFLVATVIVVSYSITLPHHEEFKPAYAAKDFKPDEGKLTDTESLKSIMDNNCSNVGNLGELQDATTKKIRDGIESDFENHDKSLKHDSMVTYGTQCLLRMSRIYGISNLQEWSDYNDAVIKGLKINYGYFLLSNQTMQQYQRARVLHDAAERDWGVNIIRFAIAGGLFSGFVMSCLLLLLVRIERNTRR